jgi:hypothetical protein
MSNTRKASYQYERAHFMDKIPGLLSAFKVRCQAIAIHHNVVPVPSKLLPGIGQKYKALPLPPEAHFNL